MQNAKNRNLRKYTVFYDLIYQAKLSSDQNTTILTPANILCTMADSTIIEKRLILLFLMFLKIGF